MQNLQFKLKKDMGVEQVGDRAHAFTWAVTMLHVGKLLSRLAHNVLCACWAPLTRVYISMWFVVFGSAIPAVFVLSLKSDWLGWVFISYFLIGVGIGVFEATFLAVIAPMGKSTKSFSILGIPTGFLTIGVPGFLLLGQGMPTQVVYWYVVACTLLSMYVVYLFVPRDEQRWSSIDLQDGQPSLAKSLKAWKVWLPLLIPHLVGKMFVNFGMENLFPVIGFTYNGDRVPLTGPRSDILMRKDNFQAVQNVVIFFGDTISRRIPYALPTKRYSTIVSIIAIAMVFEVVGFLLMKLAVAWIAWFCIGMAFFGNGLVYAAGSKYIDKSVPQEHHLAAYSLWCFMGDISSVIGAKSQDLVRGWICDDVVSAYECLSKMNWL
eukprot:TRINITY_DN51579_c0_g1_i1.p1 TRINITY_DN51579_c0_g1~~TRINITY_DN51579_c0_g1_i1.p1  ORF type:complete len:433 (-),score=77.96 TRINITY_DN51579_c0_g1_i1:78-1208(-)